MKAFVTGGTGHVGSTLVEVLINRGYEVDCLVRENSDLTFLKSLDSSKLNFHFGDLTSRESLIKAISDSQPEFVFHSAAALGRWAPWDYFYNLNVLGTQYVVDAIEKTSSVKKLIHVSTFAVYGYEDHLDAKEDTPYGKSHHSYSKSKMMGEMFLWEKYNKGEGLPLSIIRPPSVFGPHDRANFTDILRLIKNDQALVPGKGDQQNSWAYTYDIANLMLKMAEDDRATGEAFNVKTGDLTSIELIKKLAELLDLSDLKIRHIPVWLARFVGLLGSAYGVIFRRKNGPLIHRQTVRMAIRHHVCNIDKAKQVLDWTPGYSMEDALKKSIDWFLESGAYNSL